MLKSTARRPAPASFFNSKVPDSNSSSHGHRVFLLANIPVSLPLSENNARPPDVTEHIFGALELLEFIETNQNKPNFDFLAGP